MTAKPPAKPTDKPDAPNSGWWVIVTRDHPTGEDRGTIVLYRNKIDALGVIGLAPDRMRKLGAEVVPATVGFPK